jgi:protein gp37
VADGTHIQWSQATWNFVTGCTKVSEGCLNCYIERTPPFRMNGRRFDKPGIGGSTDVILHEDRLALPNRWRKPRRIFVNSLADLFHEAVPDQLIARAFAVMLANPRHTFQVLTKRHGRMRSALCSARFWRLVSDAAGQRFGDDPALPAAIPPWIWIGVSVEDQAAANLRIPALLDVPAAVRWLSCEPLLGNVYLDQRWLPGLSWVVTGGESGPGARPAHPYWFRSLRDQCDRAGIAYFHKQNGLWTEDPGGTRTFVVDTEGREWLARLRRHPSPSAAGRELDGRTWDQYPATATAGTDPRASA